MTVVGIESTVLTLAASPPRLLRPGGVSRADIEVLIGPVELAGRVENGESVPHQSPGMHRRHYSPVTPLILMAKDVPLPQGRGVYLWRERPAGAEKAIEMPGDPAGYAAVLYTLHREDQAGWDWIAVEEPPDTPEWTAVADRLWRAAASRPR
jgi:L-threonylcarbamoyladenylate synthase